MIVEILKSVGTKLKTGGKFCQEDIVVKPKLQEKSVTTNGTFSPDTGYAGFSSVTVDVPTEEGTAAPVLQDKIVNIDKNGSVDITPDSGFDGLSKAQVIVDVPTTIPDGYINPEGTRRIEENGVFDVEEYAKVEVAVPETVPEGYVKPGGVLNIYGNGIHDVNDYQYAQVEVSANLQEKSTIVSENGTIEFVPDGGYDGLSKVVVEVSTPLHVPVFYDGSFMKGVL